MRKYTEARKQGNKKWDSANLDRMSIALPRGYREAIKARADKEGLSVNAYIRDLLEKDNPGMISINSAEMETENPQVDNSFSEKGESDESE